MHITQRKEQFSKAMIHAVATAADCNVGRWEVDDDSIDVTITRQGSSVGVRSPKLDIQLKCTERCIVGTNGLSLQLKAKNYDDLRHTQDDRAIPIILVVMVVPANVVDWLTVTTPNSYNMHRFAWWHSLQNAPARTVESPSVALPAANHFTPQTLATIMDNITRKIWP